MPINADMATYTHITTYDTLPYHYAIYILRFIDAAITAIPYAFRHYCSLRRHFATCCWLTYRHTLKAKSVGDTLKMARARETYAMVYDIEMLLRQAVIIAG